MRVPCAGAVPSWLRFRGRLPGEELCLFFVFEVLDLVRRLHEVGRHPVIAFCLSLFDLGGVCLLAASL